MLQEFALSNNINFCFGIRITKMEPLLFCCHILKEHSGVVNAHYLGHSHDGDPEDPTRVAVAGAQGAQMMLLERVLSNSGLRQHLLIEKFGVDEASRLQAPETRYTAY